MAGDELTVLLPEMRPGLRRWILWTESTLPVVMEQWHVTHCGIVAAYDATELARALAMWQSGGVRCDAAAIVKEVFGEFIKP